MKYFTGLWKLREWTDEEGKYIEEAVLLVQHPPKTNLYSSIALFLNKTTQADYVIIGKTLAEDKKLVRTLAMTHGQNVQENLTYNTANAACEHVLGHNFVYFPEKLQELFPLDDFLRDVDVHGYMAVALNDREDNTIGLLSLLYKGKIARPELAEHLLFMMASLLEEELNN